VGWIDVQVEEKCKTCRGCHLVGWSPAPLEPFNIQTSTASIAAKGTRRNLRVERSQRFLARISVSINNEVSLKLSAKRD